MVALDPSDMDPQWGLVEYYTLAPGFMGSCWEEAINAANTIEKQNEVEGHRAKATIYQRKEDWLLAKKEFVSFAVLDQRYLFNMGLYCHGKLI